MANRKVITFRLSLRYTRVNNIHRRRSDITRRLSRFEDDTGSYRAVRSRCRICETPETTKAMTRNHLCFG
uniref:Uncharacterized protein n=1 Tax=Helianthus annuus TaxID=4232 RepID=A0A251S0I8_HELAN